MFKHIEKVKEVFREFGSHLHFTLFAGLLWAIAAIPAWCPLWMLGLSITVRKRGARWGQQDSCPHLHPTSVCAGGPRLRLVLCTEVGQGWWC